MRAGQHLFQQSLRCYRDSTTFTRRRRRIRVQFDDDVRTDIWIGRRDMVPELFFV
jgi:hypothetical protein